MRILLLMCLLLMAGCASNPYLDTRFGYQIDRSSDWVLQPEREWTPDESQVKLWVQAGLEWEKQISCPYIDYLVVGPWDQAFVGCSMRFGKKFYVEPALMYQVDSMSSDFLHTDQTQWQGVNPFVHLRVGYHINPAFRVNVATGNSYRSIFSGKSFGAEGDPDLYWTDIEAGVRFFGRRGLFSQEYRNR